MLKMIRTALNVKMLAIPRAKHKTMHTTPVLKYRVSNQSSTRFQSQQVQYRAGFKSPATLLVSSIAIQFSMAQAAIKLCFRRAYRLVEYIAKKTKNYK